VFYFFNDFDVIFFFHMARFIGLFFVGPTLLVLALLRDM